MLIPTLEVQAKKVFTAEELSMRRQEMARRRRNLSDKRNEEVKVRHDIYISACVGVGVGVRNQLRQY